MDHWSPPINAPVWGRPLRICFWDEPFKFSFKLKVWLEIIHFDSNGQTTTVCVGGTYAQSCFAKDAFKKLPTLCWIQRQQHFSKLKQASKMGKLNKMPINCMCLGVATTNILLRHQTVLLMRAFIAYVYTDTLPAANQAISFSTDARRTQRFTSTYSATKLLMHSFSLNTNMGCFQQTCLSPHCWHRVVKSCLHGTLRSKKTDKLVSKRTTKSWIKNLLCRDFCRLRNRKISFKLGDWMRNHFSQCISFVSVP